MNLRISPWAILLLYCVALESANLNAKSPVVYEVTTTQALNEGTMTLIGGVPIVIPSIKFERILFIDDKPGANWEHPARLQLIQGKKVVHEIRVTRPPLGLNQWNRIDPPRKELPPEIKVSDLGGKYKVSEPSHHFALLINGYADERHWNDFSFLYQTLTRVYGYLPQNIFIADSMFREHRPDLDQNGTPDILFGSKRADLESLFLMMQNKIGSADKLLVVANDHGSTKDGESSLILADCEIKASEFAKHLKAVPAQTVLSIFEQCFSGGFVRPTVGPGRVSLASSTNTEISWASDDGNFDEFLYLLTSAFAHQTHEGKSVTADLDGNSRITAREAYAFAIANGHEWESPFLEAISNNGAAFLIGFD